MDKSAIPAIKGELWRDVPGYEGLYRASNRGRVLSLPRPANGRMYGGQLLKVFPTGRPGYERLTVTLSKDDAKDIRRVHQLVMLTFAGRCPEGQEVRHLDGNPFNNRWEPGETEEETRAAGGNLFYGTHVENARDMVEHGTANLAKTRGTQRRNAKLTEELVPLIRAEYAAGGVTERALASRYGVDVATIHAALVRRTWRHVA